jgi:hypothetical protein
LTDRTQGTETTYIVGCVNGREVALEATEVASGSTSTTASKKISVILSILDRCHVVSGRSELVGVIAEGGSFASEEVVTGAVSNEIVSLTTSGGLT